MEHLWRLEKAFIKELINSYPDPKPATTTLVTLLRRMADKGFVNYETSGGNRQYYPIIDKSAYFSKHVNGLIQKFFNNSSSMFASFFTKETNLSEQELEELQKIVAEEIKKRKL